MLLLQINRREDKELYGRWFELFSLGKSEVTAELCHYVACPLIC